MTQMGMDVEAVESVGRQLKQGAAAVDPIVGTLDKAVSSLAQLWDGPDAQRLIQSWPTFRKSLVAAQASIAGLGQSALNNASEQRQASGAGARPAVVPLSAMGPVAPAVTPTAHPGEDLGTSQQPGPSATIGTISHPPVSQDAYEHRAGNIYTGASGAKYSTPPDWCTSWVQFRRDQLGLPVPHGNGSEMAGNLASHSPAPSLGAVGSWGPGVGHTFVVEGIASGDPRVITISEMNSGSGAHPWVDKSEGITNNFGKVTTQTYTEVPPAGSGVWKDSNYHGTVHRGVTFGQ